MKFTLQTSTGQPYEAYAYTGGKAFDATKPTLVFIHGVLNDHSVWILQSRYLAHHGFNVLAVDLPGHGRSAGRDALDGFGLEITGRVSIPVVANPENIDYLRTKKAVRIIGLPHAAGVATDRVGERKGVGVTELEAEAQSEQLRGKLLGRDDEAAFGQLGEQQHRQRRRQPPPQRVAQHLDLAAILLGKGLDQAVSILKCAVLDPERSASIAPCPRFGSIPAVAHGCASVVHGWIGGQVVDSSGGW